MGGRGTGFIKGKNFIPTGEVTSIDKWAKVVRSSDNPGRGYNDAAVHCHQMSFRSQVDV